MSMDLNPSFPTTNLGTMFCPNCQGKTLETVQTVHGRLDRCSNCLYFLAEQTTLADFSTDRDRFLAAIEETSALLLPTSHPCPRCFQPLDDGRASSAGVILTIC